MTRRRWIADEVRGDRALLLGEHAAHLARVLRARMGQEFDISTGERVRRGRITSITADRVEFELGEDVPQAAPPNIILLLSIFKFDRMEWALEKTTELGVARIIPVIGRRTEKHLAAAAEKRVQRWRKIVLQAAQQSRRTAAPQIDAPVALEEALALVAGARIVLAETEHGLMLRDAIGDAEGDVALAVGPEGGWTEHELARFAAAGWKAASLGQGILRAETAAIAAVAVVSALTDR